MIKDAMRGISGLEAGADDKQRSLGALPVTRMALASAKNADNIGRMKHSIIMPFRIGLIGGMNLYW